METDSLNISEIFPKEWFAVKVLPTTDRPPTTKNRPSTHRQIPHQPTDNQQPTTDPPTSASPTHGPLTINSQIN